MEIEFKATKRVEQGTGASRRLRRAGQFPGIIYGTESEAQPVTLNHNELFHLMRREAFHSSILTANVDGKKEQVVLRDAQWHPFKPQVMHLDFQRVNTTEKIHLKVPLHFVNGEESPAVKLDHQMITHVLTEIDVTCLAKDLPEFIEVDLGAIEADQSVHASELKLPSGVEIAIHGGGDPVVATALKTKGKKGDSNEGDEDSEENGEEQA